MVQKRQWRNNRCDSHYAAAIFHYQHEFAVNFSGLTSFVCLDDKHSSKVGEPGFPVAAAQCGQKVTVRAGTCTSFEVGDHNFTKFSAVPSVALIN